jgi:hypothetical protein
MGRPSSGLRKDRRLGKRGRSEGFATHRRGRGVRPRLARLPARAPRLRRGHGGERRGGTRRAPLGGRRPHPLRPQAARRERARPRSAPGTRRAAAGDPHRLRHGHERRGVHARRCYGLPPQAGRCRRAAARRRAPARLTAAGARGEVPAASRPRPASGAGGGLGRLAPGRRAAAPRGAGVDDRAPARGVRYRQGGGGAAAPPPLRPRRRPVRHGQLRRHSPRAVRERVLRPPPGSVHGRHGGSRRALPGGARRHAVSRRGQLAAGAGAGEDPASAAGRQLRAGRGEPADDGRRADGLREQRGPRRRGGRRPLPRRPLLPDQRHDDPHLAPARAARRHPRSPRPSSPSSRRGSASGSTASAPARCGPSRTYSWPGNVRELRNVVERAVLLEQGRHG